MRFYMIAVVVLLFIWESASIADEIILHSKKVKEASLNSEDAVWQKAVVVQIPLIPQNNVVPHGGGSTKFVEVKSIYTSRDLFFQLSWEDKSKSDKIALGGKFTDACAVQFPLEKNAMPSPFMGEKNDPVNIWMWRAMTQETERYVHANLDIYGAIEEPVKFPVRPVQSLLAEGFGTLTLGPVQDIEGSGTWKNVRWTVVFKRSLSSKNGTGFKDRQPIPIAFAIWDGDGDERDGTKSLSLWHTLVLGEAKIPELKTDLEKGQRVFARYGCATCHGQGGQGEIKNPNAKGNKVPSIHRVKEGFTEKELKKVIRKGRVSELEDPQGPSPPLRMIVWENVMSEEEINVLVKYLFSLMPKGEEEKW